MRRVKKVIICGATHTSNFGDVLFGEMFRQRIESALPGTETLFFNIGKFNKETLVFKKSSFSDNINADALVYLSGGLFCSSSKPKTIRRYIKILLILYRYYYYGVVSAIRKRPIAMVGVDVGPLYTSIQRNALKFIIKRSKLIVVRNQDSANFIKSLGIQDNNIIISSDSALAIKNFIMPSPKENILSRQFRYVVIHVTKHAKMEHYCRHIVPAVAKVFEGEEDVRFLVTDDFMIDNPYLELAKNNLPADKTVMYTYHNPFDTLGIIQGCDTIITPKLHLGIYGCIYHKTVFSFPIHPEKTTRFYMQIGYSNHCNSLRDTSFEAACQILSAGRGEQAVIPAEFTRMAERNFELLDEFCKSI